MAFKKYQKVEKVEVLNDKDQEKVKTFISKLGKKSKDLTEEERAALQKELDN
jgi:hypothetical protein